MTRVQQCKVCGHDLYCADCGTRRTPLKEKKREFIRIALTTNDKRTLEQVAAMANITVSKLVYSLLKTHFNNLDGTGYLEAVAESVDMTVKEYLRSMLRIEL